MNRHKPVKFTESQPCNQKQKFGSVLDLASLQNRGRNFSDIPQRFVGKSAFQRILLIVELGLYFSVFNYFNDFHDNCNDSSFYFSNTLFINPTSTQTIIIFINPTSIYNQLHESNFDFGKNYFIAFQLPLTQIHKRNNKIR